jgi:hypothetical protein
VTLYARLKSDALGPRGIPWYRALCGLRDCGTELAELAALDEHADEHLRRLADGGGRVLQMSPGLVRDADGVWQLSRHAVGRLRRRMRPKTARPPQATEPGEVVRFDNGRSGLDRRACARPPVEVRCPACGSRQTITAG